MTPHNRLKFRRTIAVLVIASAISLYSIITGIQEQSNNPLVSSPPISQIQGEAVQALEALEVKGRAPKTGYTRSLFGEGWRKSGDCTTRELILQRDLENPVIEVCKVFSGTLNDPYTAKTIAFQRGADTSDNVQIDHIVALSDAWQKGAQNLTQVERENLANDPLELVAVDGPTNQKKSDGDAATWLPPNKSYRCQYVARQIAVKQKYRLWVTQAEKQAMRNVLVSCPNQTLPKSE